MNLPASVACSARAPVPLACTMTTMSSPITTEPTCSPTSKAIAEPRRSLRRARVTVGVLACAVAVLASACFGNISHSYTHTAHDTFETKPPDCAFDIQSTGPSAAEYDEIGTVGGCSGTSDLAEYKEQIAPFVCRAAGDLVMAEINSNGVYCRGIVFHRRPEQR